MPRWLKYNAQSEMKQYLPRDRGRVVSWQTMMVTEVKVEKDAHAHLRQERVGTT